MMFIKILPTLLPKSNVGNRLKWIVIVLDSPKNWIFWLKRTRFYPDFINLQIITNAVLFHSTNSMNRVRVPYQLSDFTRDANALKIRRVRNNLKS